MADLPVLVVIETQRVKHYLLASPILRETRGASLLLDRLNRIHTRALAERRFPDAEVVYLGGGSGRLLFPRVEEAARFAAEVQELYRRETGNARVAVEVVEREAGEGFPAWVARGVGQAQARKLGRMEGTPLLGGRWLRPCSSCGAEPAEVFHRDVQGPHHLCAPCHAKRRQVGRLYREVKPPARPRLPAAEELRRNYPDHVLTTLAERAGAGAAVSLPQDFDGIGDAAFPRGYVGLIYADGNAMGEAMRRMAAEFPGDEEARGAYAAFSAIADAATREAAAVAVLSEVARSGREGTEPVVHLPAELILAGGDDLILMVPADRALAVAGSFVADFQRRSRELQEEWVAAGRLSRPFAPEGLTISAGVVLAHASFPASQLLERAGDLMKSAKRLAAGSTEGTVDFEVVHEAGSAPALERRRQEYEGALPSGAPLRRTERPYTVSGLGRLLELLRRLRAAAVPRGKLKELYQGLFVPSIPAAQFAALSIKERLRATGALGQGPLAELFAELNHFPFRRRDGEAWTTPLTEVVELYDFVPRAGPGGGEEARGDG
jgi:Cas10/Cmr2, second palm domain